MKRRLVVIAGILALVLAMPAMTASAQITRNTIDPLATMNLDGSVVQVSGPIACGVGDVLKLTVVVIQQSNWAVGWGTSEIDCAGDATVLWSVDVDSVTRRPFEEGPAWACALGVLFDDGRPEDARYWCAANGIEIARAV